MGATSGTPTGRPRGRERVRTIRGLAERNAAGVGVRADGEGCAGCAVGLAAIERGMRGGWPRGRRREGDREIWTAIAWNVAVRKAFRLAMTRWDSLQCSHRTPFSSAQTMAESAHIAQRAPHTFRFRAPPLFLPPAPRPLTPLSPRSPARRSDAGPDEQRRCDARPRGRAQDADVHPGPSRYRRASSPCHHPSPRSSHLCP